MPELRELTDSLELYSPKIPLQACTEAEGEQFLYPNGIAMQT